ncbi:hypothetical protein Naga_100013g48 [Nannochloropsis gaditana]|uniref:Uncharacterized protein n=1 Tax=Nannochloropsis gaditana TaxID=72520 RepID=W7TTL2_9STRA|nr:hypothetical protein Naga_100013g48 [Nannochloropsis gaditana]
MRKMSHYSLVSRAIPVSISSRICASPLSYTSSPGFSLQHQRTQRPQYLPMLHSTTTSLFLVLGAMLCAVTKSFIPVPARASRSVTYFPAKPTAISLVGSTMRLTPYMFMSTSNFDEPLILTEENAALVLEAARQELGTMFGYTKENQAVGITGEVDLVAVEGISIIVRLKNRFWHDRKMVLTRISKFITDRIPEAMVEIEDVEQLKGDDAKSVSDFYAH